MANVLADIFGYGNTLKRKVNGLLDDPRGSLEQFVGQLNDQMTQNNSNMDKAGWGLGKQPFVSVLADNRPSIGNGSALAVTPQQREQAQAQVSSDAANAGLAAMFVGKGSKTWDAVNAKKAEELAAKGVEPRAIWSETGTWKGPDGKWRQEIPDNAATLPFSGDRSARADMVLKHKDLYSAYPEFAGKSFTIDSALGKSNGDFNPNNYQIRVGSPDKSTALHEFQHAIQENEGFARGGSPSEFNQQDVAEKARDMLSWQREVKSRLEKNPALDWHGAEASAVKEYKDIGWPEGIPSAEVRKMAVNPLAYFGDQPEDFVKLYGLDQRVTPYSGKELYKRLAGEAEARATQARIPLDAAQRRALFPEDSYDVPVNQLIVRGLLGK
jgi:hypothetical protein